MNMPELIPDTVQNEGATPEQASLGQLVQSTGPAVLNFINLLADLKAAFISAVENVVAGLRSTVALYPQVEPIVKQLAKRTCFLSGHFGASELLTFAQLCNNSSVDQMEAHVLELYRSSFDVHVQSILNDYPDRAVFINPAVEAHHRGDYGLAILGFLSQADGICAEGLKANLFFKSDSLRKDVQLRLKSILTDEKWEEIDIITPYRRLMLWPLSELQPVGYSEKKRLGEGYTGLNRHCFLHGEASASEVTEENSLRAFSLLSYLTSVCRSVVFWDEIAAEAEAAQNSKSTQERV